MTTVDLCTIVVWVSLMLIIAVAFWWHEITGFFGRRHKGEEKMSKQVVHLHDGSNLLAGTACGASGKVSIAHLRGQVTCPKCWEIIREWDKDNKAGQAALSAHSGAGAGAGLSEVTVGAVHWGEVVGGAPKILCGDAKCGLTPILFTSEVDKVTCERCNEALRDRVRERRLVPEPETKVHYHYSPHSKVLPVCGNTDTNLHTTGNGDNVTCSDCLRWLGREGWKQEKPEGRVHYSPDNRTLPICSNDNPNPQVTGNKDEVTCGKCLHRLGLVAWMRSGGRAPEEKLDQKTVEDARRKILSEEVLSAGEVHLAHKGGAACGETGDYVLTDYGSRVTCPSCKEWLKKYPLSGATHTEGSNLYRLSEVSHTEGRQGDERERPKSPELVHLLEAGEKVVSCGTVQPEPSRLTTEVLDVTCIGCLKSYILKLENDVTDLRESLDNLISRRATFHAEGSPKQTDAEPTVESLSCTLPPPRRHDRPSVDQLAILVVSATNLLHTAVVGEWGDTPEVLAAREFLVNLFKGGQRWIT